MTRSILISLLLLAGLSACDSAKSPLDNRLLGNDELAETEAKATKGDDAALDRLQAHFSAKGDSASAEKWLRTGVQSGSVKYRIWHLDRLLTHVEASKNLTAFDKHCAGLALTNLSTRLYLQADTDEDRRSALSLHMQGTNLVLRNAQPGPGEDGKSNKCEFSANLPSRDLLEFRVSG